MKTEILKLLRSTDGYVSGQQISEQLGVSRAAVWKTIRRLQDEGYQVEAVRNKGYHIVETPDVMTKEELDSLMKTRWAGRKVRWRWPTDRRRDADGGAGPGSHRQGTVFICLFCSGLISRRIRRLCLQSLWRSVWRKGLGNGFP